MICPACSSNHSICLQGQLYRCERCNCIYGTCRLVDSFEFVLPFMATIKLPSDRLAYFELNLQVKNGALRHRHGWFDPQTKLIHQIG